MQQNLHFMGKYTIKYALCRKMSNMHFMQNKVKYANKYALHVLPSPTHHAVLVTFLVPRFARL